MSEADILQEIGPATHGAASERAKTEAYNQGLRDASVFKAEQENDLRDKFFKVAVWLTFVIVGTSIVGIGAYIFLKGSQMSESVIITWITAVVVEIIAILKIMAKYLFPESSNRADDS